MPIYQRSDGKPVVEIDPGLEVSPFTLFRRLREGRSPLLIDVRAQPGETTLRDSIGLPDATWEPPDKTEIVLFDDDGTLAVDLVRKFQADGHEGVRALFGGLDLYVFSLDPDVVGEETFLVATGSKPAVK